jgi:hypothetical protein
MDFERIRKLIREHPPTVPDDIGKLHYLINVPVQCAPSSSFVRFRELTLVPLMRDYPDNPDWPKFFRCVEAVLAWRATIPAKDRFWQERPRLIISNDLDE